MQIKYITAVVALITSGLAVEVVLQNLKSVLKQRGHSSLHNAIMRGVVVKLETIQKRNLPNVTVARNEDVTTDKILALLSPLGSESTAFTVTIDPTIIGGSIITYRHRQIDQSYKTKLTSLYQSVIS